MRYYLFTVAVILYGLACLLVDRHYYGLSMLVAGVSGFLFINSYLHYKKEVKK